MKLPRRNFLHLAAGAAADSISAIAFETGFTDLSTFNRRFRRVIRSRPSAYRAGSGIVHGHP